MLSGSPSRSRGPGNSSRKKSASPASKHRSPLGTIGEPTLARAVRRVVSVQARPDAVRALPPASAAGRRSGRRRLVAVGGPLGQAGQADARQFAGHGRVDLPQRPRIAVLDLVHSCRRLRETAGGPSAARTESLPGSRCRCGRPAGAPRRAPVRATCRRRCRAALPGPLLILVVHGQAEVGHVGLAASSIRMLAGFRSRCTSRGGGRGPRPRRRRSAARRLAGAAAAGFQQSARLGPGCTAARCRPAGFPLHVVDPHDARMVELGRVAGLVHEEFPRVVASKRSEPGTFSATSRSSCVSRAR